MQLISVNLGHKQPIKNGKPSGVSGIYKQSAPAGVQLTRDGLVDDYIADHKNHGGPDQAVYVYGVPDYEWWSRELGRELAPGTFGENLTVAGLESARLSVGDKLHIGAATLQVTAARIPCVTLAARMDDPAFVKRFRHGERPGVYCRVLAEGIVHAGDDVRLEPYASETVTVLEMFRDWYEPDKSAATIRRYLASPLARRARVHKKKQLRDG